MTEITALQNDAITRMQETMQVSPVALKHTYPVRPGRMLRLIRLDAQAFTAERLTRAVFLQISLPLFVKVFSTFIFPKIEYDLPVFTCETIVMGGKRVFVLDAHPGGGGGEQRHDTFYDRLVEIRTRYPELMHFQKAAPSGMASLQSPAAVRVTVPRDHDPLVTGIFTHYFAAYLDLVNTVAPVSGLARAKLQSSFEAYLKTVVDHDPGVKGNIMFFGKKKGVERALDLYYGI